MVTPVSWEPHPELVHGSQVDATFVSGEYRKGDELSVYFCCVLFLQVLFRSLLSPHPSHRPCPFTPRPSSPSSPPSPLKYVKCVRVSFVLLFFPSHLPSLVPLAICLIRQSPLALVRLLCMRAVELLVACICKCTFTGCIVTIETWKRI